MSIILNGTTGITTPTETATTSVTTPIVTSPASTALTIQSAGTTAMTVDTSQNVLIGDTNSYGKLFVSQQASNTCAFFSIESSAGSGYVAARVNTNLTTQKNMTLEYLGVAKGTFKTDAGSVIFDGTQGTTIFQTVGSEAMRIDSSGNLLVGMTTSAVGQRFSVTSTGTWNTFLYVPNGNSGIGITNASGTATYAAYTFYNNGTSYTLCGNITVSGTSASYNTSSDYRLKENVAPMTTGLATVVALKPVIYNWISTQEKGEGFIAHELAEVVPLAVNGEKDAVDEEGNIKPQGVDYSKIVVHLVAAIQELSAENDALEARLVALEAK
jgi:hypothetical protein